MKIIPIGDIHGLTIWQQIIEKEKDADKFIFIGDYADSFKESAAQQINNLENICEFKRQNFGKVDLILGNHDMYIDNSNQSTGGYQPRFASYFYKVYNDNKDLFVMASHVDKILFTHAGVSETWLEQLIAYNYIDGIPETAWELTLLVNDVWKYKPHLFQHVIGNERSGNYLSASPIWIRPKSLIEGSKTIKKNGIIQVVGHTATDKLDMSDESYYFIDTLQTSKEYLVIDINEEITITKRVIN